MSKKTKKILIISMGVFMLISTMLPTIQILVGK